MRASLKKSVKPATAATSAMTMPAPYGGSGPEAVAGSDEGEIGDGRADQEGYGEWDDHGVERMIADGGGRLGVDAHGKTSREVIFQTIFRARAGSSNVMSATAGAGSLPTACARSLSGSQIRPR